MSVADDGELTAAGLLDEQVVTARLEMLGTALDGPLRVGTYTDEELAALDDLNPHPVQPSPWFGSLTDAEKQTAMTAALRGLTARGVYRAEQLDVASRTFRPVLDPSILALLTLRRYVPHLVVVERTTAEHVAWALLYPQRGETFLIEYGDHVGLHEFVVTDAETAVQAMIEWTGSNAVLLDDAASVTSAPDLDVTLDRAAIEEQPTVLDPLAACLFASTVTRFDPGAPGSDDWRAVHAGHAGSFVAEPVDDSVRYRGTSVDDLATWWSEVIL